MKINYQDEYGEPLYSANADIVPSIGHTVILNSEDYKVRDVVWMVNSNYVIVEVTQNLVRTQQKESNDLGRLNSLHGAILAVNKRQDASEKKSRALNEQIGSIRKHINQRIQQERKIHNDT